MAQGIIPFASIPSWPNPPLGLLAAVENAGIYVVMVETGFSVSDVATANSIISGYVGSATQLSWNRAQKQAALDALLDNNFDLRAFIRAGTSTTVTATNVGTFLSTITDNYRSLRAQIAAAADVTTLNAINVNSGWPSNP